MVDQLTLSDGRRVASLRYAARRAGVAERTLRTWEQTGRITRLTTVGRTRYYELGEVLAAERATRAADPTRKRSRALARRLAPTAPVGHIGA